MPFKMMARFVLCTMSVAQDLKLVFINFSERVKDNFF